MAKKRNQKIKISSIVIYVFLIIWALTTIFPLVWSVVNSFKDKRAIYSNSFSLPIGSLFSLDNYKNIFENYNILSAYKNSFIISGTAFNASSAVLMIKGRTMITSVHAPARRDIPQ